MYATSHPINPSGLFLDKVVFVGSEEKFVSVCNALDHMCNGALVMSVCRKELPCAVSGVLCSSCYSLV